MGFNRKISAARQKGIGRFAVTFLLLLAFAFQSCLTQTHIHGYSIAPAQACAVKCAVHVSVTNPSPLGEAAADCPLCQAIVHAGAFFAPAQLPFFGPRVLAVASLLFAKPLVARAQFARDGLSRAPPR